MDPAVQAEAERAALRIVLRNVVAQMVAAGTTDPLERRDRLANMNDQCRLAAEQAISQVASVDRSRYVGQVIAHLDDFYRGITIT